MALTYPRDVDFTVFSVAKAVAPFFLYCGFMYWLP